MGADEGYIRVPSFVALGYVTAILGAKNRQKMDKFEPVYLGNYFFEDLDYQTAFFGDKKDQSFFGDKIHTNTQSTTFLMVIFIYLVVGTIIFYFFSCFFFLFFVFISFFFFRYLYLTSKAQRVQTLIDCRYQKGLLAT